jgi:hypothetical protein
MNIERDTLAPIGNYKLIVEGYGLLNLILSNHLQSLPQSGGNLLRRLILRAGDRARVLASVLGSMVGQVNGRDPMLIDFKLTPEQQRLRADTCACAREVLSKVEAATQDLPTPAIYLA